MGTLCVRLGGTLAALAVLATGTAVGSSAQAADAPAEPTVTEMRIGPFLLPPAPLGAAHGSPAKCILYTRVFNIVTMELEWR